MNATEYCGGSCHTMEYYGIPWNTTEYYLIVWNAIEYIKYYETDGILGCAATEFYVIL
jgi:hypothetical protein